MKRIWTLVLGSVVGLGMTACAIPTDVDDVPFSDWVSAAEGDSVSEAITTLLETEAQTQDVDEIEAVLNSGAPSVIYVDGDTNAYLAAIQIPEAAVEASGVDVAAIAEAAAQFTLADDGTLASVELMDGE